jgi:hypothetical protein
VLCFSFEPDIFFLHETKIRLFKFFWDMKNWYFLVIFLNIVVAIAGWGYLFFASYMSRYFVLWNKKKKNMKCIGHKVDINASNRNVARSPYIHVQCSLVILPPFGPEKFMAVSERTQLCMDMWISNESSEWERWWI